MSKHAVMPLTDYVNVCDTLREKIGTTEPIKSGDIPKKVNDIYDMGKLATLKDSKYMNGKESGTIVSVNDVTPIEHNVGVKVASKNLFDYSPLIDANKITVNDEATGEFTITSAPGSIQIPIKALENTQYYISGYIKGTVDGDSDGLSVYYTDGTIQNVRGSIVVGEYVKMGAATSKNKTISHIVLTGAGGFNVGSMLKEIQIEQGTTATAYTPYVADFTGVEVRKCGANLFPFAESITVRGRHLNGNRSDFLPPQTDIEFLRGKVIRYSVYFDLSSAVEDTANANCKIIFYDGNGAIINQQFGNSIDKSKGKIQGYSTLVPRVPENAHKIDFHVSVYFNITAKPDDNSFVTVSQGMVTLGNTAREYEPYTETIYTANADGTVEGVKSISPNMTLIPNNNAVTVECEYLRDIDLYIDNLLKSVAMIGGE